MYLYYDTEVTKLHERVRSIPNLTLEHKAISFKGSTLSFLSKKGTQINFNYERAELECPDLFRVQLKPAGKFKSYRALKFPKNFHFLGFDSSLTDELQIIRFSFASPKTLTKLEQLYNLLDINTIDLPRLDIVVPVPANTPLYDLSSFHPAFSELVTKDTLYIGFANFGSCIVLFIDSKDKERLEEEFIPSNTSLFTKLHDKLDKIVYNLIETVFKVLKGELMVTRVNDVRLDSPLSSFVAKGSAIQANRASVELKQSL